MQLNGVHHVSLNVNDVSAAQQFYEGVLGLQVLPRPELNFPGLWLKSGAQELHLLGIDSGSPLKEQHFAFAVENLDQVIAELEEAGLECSEPREMTGICRQAFTHDPSGNLIEFNQRL